MTSEARRVYSSVSLFGVALLMGSLALSTAFSAHPIVFSKSARADEIIEDVIGIVASALAFAAAVYAYSLRGRLWVRLYLAVVTLVAFALAFEFLLSFIWFAFDKFVPFGQRH
jgi:hypothetical protein